MKKTALVVELAKMGFPHNAASHASIPADATAAAKQANSALLEPLSFSDNSDFSAANKAFIASLPID